MTIYVFEMRAYDSTPVVFDTSFEAFVSKKSEKNIEAAKQFLAYQLKIDPHNFRFGLNKPRSYQLEESFFTKFIAIKIELDENELAPAKQYLEMFELVEPSKADFKNIVSCEVLARETHVFSYLLKSKNAEAFNQALAGLSDYLIEHLNRFSQFQRDPSPAAFDALSKTFKNYSDKEYKYQYSFLSGDNSLQQNLTVLSNYFTVLKTELSKSIQDAPIINLRKIASHHYMAYLIEVEKAIQYQLNFLGEKNVLFSVKAIALPELKLAPLPNLLEQQEEKIDPRPTPSVTGLIEEFATLESLPTPHPYTLTQSDNIVIGDLHGNFCKLIYLLVRENIIIPLSPKYFDIAKHLMNKDAEQFTPDDLKAFNVILSAIIPTHPNESPTLQFIGDLMADRRGNDYFTLKMLERLTAINIPYTIFLSNHDLEFICAYERNELKAPSTKKIPRFDSMLPAYHACSLYKLGMLITRNLIEPQEIIRLTEQYYLPAITALRLDINQSTDQLTLMSHAPISLITIPQIFNQLKLGQVKENDLFSAKEYFDMVKKINSAVRILLKNKRLHEVALPSTPLYNLLWQRSDYFVFFETMNPDRRTKDKLAQRWKIQYVHGHDGDGVIIPLNPFKQTDVNLDNSLGKEREHDKTPKLYTIFYMGQNQKFLMQRMAAELNEKGVVKNPKRFEPELQLHSFFKCIEKRIQCPSTGVSEMLRK